MKSTLTRLSMAFVAMLLTTAMYAQLTAWQYRMPVTITDTSGSNQTNYQVRLSVNTAVLISAGHMQATGDDIRFADSCGTVIYDHYIESGINTTNTLIWVRIPSIPANGNALCYLFYGNASATATASFAGTFPAAYISGGANITLTGALTYDWFQLDANDTVFVQTGALLAITARNIIINGAISGNGAGYQAPGANLNGNGPGAGTTSANSGSGGGSYGGQGGLGGMDAGDTPGNGGAVYGTANGTDLDMGSSGGSGTVVGGSGGGAVILHADYVSVNGAINMNGATAPATASRGGGGGAGGGILLWGADISFSGTMNANGGGGGAGTSTFNDGGGGGGGGRIKALHTGTIMNTGTATATFGPGGPYGDAAYGQPGATGTVSFTNGGGHALPLSVTGSEVLLAPPALTLSAVTVCAGDSVIATASAGFTSYIFMLNGTPVDTTTSSSYTYTVLSNGDSISVTGVITCLAYNSTSTAVTVNPDSDAGTVMSTASICAGDTVTLSTTGYNGTITWYDFDGTNYSMVGAGDVLTLGILTAGTYSFVAVADNGGCAVDTSAFTTTTVNAAAAGVVSSTLADTNLCAFDTILFSTTGSSGLISWIVQVNQGPWFVFGTGNPYNPGPPTNGDVGSYLFAAVASVAGCPDDTSSALNVYVRPTPEVSLGNDTTLCAGPLTLDAGNPGEMYIWSNGDSTQFTNVQSSGMYAVVVTTMYGCAGTDTINVTINAEPVITFTGATACVDDGSITLTASPAGGTFSGPGVTGNSFSPSAAGTGAHTVTYSYTDANGCTGSGTAVMTVNACVGIAENSPLEAAVVYPNPNNGTFNVAFGSAVEGAVTIEVVDVAGRVIFAEQQNNIAAGAVVPVTLDGASAGTYFLRVTANDSQRMEKLILE